MKIDWKLKGSNLLKFNCNKDQIVHSETCSDMVLMGHDGEMNLTDWIKGSTASIGNSLEDWIVNNLSGSISIDTSWNPNTNLGTLDNNNSIDLGYIAANTDNPVRVPYTTYSQIGLLGVNPNSTFTVSNGVLSLNPATSNYYGGIKIGFNSSGSNYAVELDSHNKAYVNVPITNTLSYYTLEGDHGLTPFQDRPTGICSDGEWANVDFGNLNDGEWYNKITSLLSNSPTSSLDRIYPILADKDGRLYTYVNWTDTNTTYSKLSNSSSASNSYVVPGSGANSSKFLRGDGTWQDPYNTLSSSAHASNTNYVVKGSGYITSPTKFLREDGTWDTPTNTTYDIATENNKQGLLQIMEGCLDTSCDVVEPSGSQKNIVPVVYNAAESKEGHGVVLEDIVDAISNDTELLRIIAKAMADDVEPTVGCVDILKAVINP